LLSADRLAIPGFPGVLDFFGFWFSQGSQIGGLSSEIGFWFFFGSL
jgi:hypothetical protein